MILIFRFVKTNFKNNISYYLGEEIISEFSSLAAFGVIQQSGHPTW